MAVTVLRRELATEAVAYFGPKPEVELTSTTNVNLKWFRGKEEARAERLVVPPAVVVRHQILNARH